MFILDMAKFGCKGKRISRFATYNITTSVRCVAGVIAESARLPSAHVFELPDVVHDVLGILFPVAHSLLSPQLRFLASERVIMDDAQILHFRQDVVLVLLQLDSLIIVA
jgi:hypothetical protein